ncbi:hypothetical protein QT970_12070 [Microcoleus sp. herbarium8]
MRNCTARYPPLSISSLNRSTLGQIPTKNIGISHFDSRRYSYIDRPVKPELPLKSYISHQIAANSLQNPPASDQNSTSRPVKNLPSERFLANIFLIVAP